MRKYETIIVIDSLLKLEEIEGIINKYERFISANGGQIETTDRWGKRRRAHRKNAPGLAWADRERHDSGR